MELCPSLNYNYSLPTTSSYTHPQIIGSFYLPNSTEGLPFVYTGVNTNLSKEFKQFPFTLEQYLHKSLQAKKTTVTQSIVYIIGSTFGRWF